MVGTKAEGGMARRQFAPVVVKHVCPHLPEIPMDVSRSPWFNFAFMPAFFLCFCNLMSWLAFHVLPHPRIDWGLLLISLVNGLAIQYQLQKRTPHAKYIMMVSYLLIFVVVIGYL